MGFPLEEFVVIGTCESVLGMATRDLFKDAHWYFYVFYATKIQSYGKNKFFLLITFEVFLSNVN